MKIEGNFCPNLATNGSISGKKDAATDSKWIKADSQTHLSTNEHLSPPLFNVYTYDKDDTAYEALSYRKKTRTRHPMQMTKGKPNNA